jgi:fucose permease
MTSTVPNRGRLFFGSCAAVTALAFSFATLAGVMFDLKTAFVLDNVQIGLIAGAGLWGMALSQVGFSLLCDVIGMRNLLRMAFLGHVAGMALFVTATGFSSLFTAALVTAIANGVIEAVCNPLVATLYPERKAGMLNRLHLWFPGGVAIGGLLVWGLGLMHAGWQAKILVGLLPALLYAFLLLRQSFPKTEAAQSGAGLLATVRAVATTPLLWGFLLLMGVTMSLELGPNRWIPSVLESGGLPGILVLVLINGVMALMRANAHAILDRASPPVVLMLGAAVAGAGLWWLSLSSGLVGTVAAALVFAIGIAVVWPTMMGFISERAPATGALGLGLMAAAGSLSVGVITTPMLGEIADSHLPAATDNARLQAVAGQVLADPSASPKLAALASEVRASSAAPPPVTGDFLRRTAAGEAGPEAAAAAAPVLNAAENHSGLLSFRYLVPFAFLVSLLFGAVVLWDRRSGGYAAQVERARLNTVLPS